MFRDTRDPFDLLAYTLANALGGRQRKWIGAE